MLIESQNTTAGFIKAKEYLDSLPHSIDDELKKESPLLIIFDSLIEDKSLPTFDGKNFKARIDYSKLINQDQGFVHREFSHYEKLLDNEIQSLLEYLRETPLSKRAIIDVWSKNQRNLDNRAECLIYLSFRKTFDGLDLHVHMRANNAKDKALLNFHIFAAVQSFVAKKLNLKAGKYYHFSDSYHIYK